MIAIERIRPTEADRYRDIRLRALRDAPSAFATTLAEAEAFGHDVWQSRVAAAATGIDSTLYVATDAAGADVGMVAGIRNTSDPTTAELISMWVAPSARRSGAGAGLVGQVIDWAADSGYSRVELWVTRGNAAAERLYRRAGFRETGDVKPLPSDPCKNELRMRLDLEAHTS